MDLSAEQFAEVLNSLGVPRLPAGDKRRANRVMHRCHTTISLGNNPATDDRVSASVKDFSPRGIGLLLHEPLDAGAQFVMYMPRRNQDPVRILCTATNCREVGKGLYVIGAEFTTLISSAPPPPADDVARVRESILD